MNISEMCYEDWWWIKLAQDLFLVLWLLNLPGSAT
jgi:hypothetical protein